MVVSHSWPNTSESFHFVIKAQCFLCSPQPGNIKGFIVYLSANTEKESRPPAQSLHPTLPEENAGMFKITKHN